MLALFTAPSASAFTVYNSADSARGANYGDPDGQAHAVGAGERGKSVGVPRNYVSPYSGVMPGTHETLPPPSGLFKTAKPKASKSARASR